MHPFQHNYRVKIEQEITSQLQKLMSVIRSELPKNIGVGLKPITGTRENPDDVIIGVYIILTGHCAKLITEISFWEMPSSLDEFANVSGFKSFNNLKNYINRVNA